MKIMDREDRRKEVELLEKLGYKRVEAALLVFFMEKRTGKAREIEQAMCLRQPEVSKEIRTLIDGGILTMTDVSKKGRGRPGHLYTALPRDKILAMVKEKTLVRIKEMQRNLEQLG